LLHTPTGARSTHPSVRGALGLGIEVQKGPQNDGGEPREDVARCLDTGKYYPSCKVVALEAMMNRSKTSAGSAKVPEGRANPLASVAANRSKWNAALSATSRFSAATVALAAAGALAWTGCGSSANSLTCDDAGVCMQCDGYGCSAVTPGNTLDAGIDTGITPIDKDSGSKPKPDAAADATPRRTRARAMRRATPR